MTQTPGRTTALGAIAAAVLTLAGPARAEDLATLAPSVEDGDGDTLLPHPNAAWWLSAQVNVIGQAQPGFHSAYTGDNSFRSDDHAAVSAVASIFAGYELTPVTALVVVGESVGGGGLSHALGLAGFTNLDVLRTPSLGAMPYLARAFIDQIIPLSSTWAAHDRDPIHLLRKLPTRRLEIRVGKLLTTDMFDVNAAGSDSHLQFMNWAIDGNGAYDNAADARGYTLGAVVEYAQDELAIRFGEMLMPSEADGVDYDFDLANARSENIEAEYHDQIAGRAGTVRLRARRQGLPARRRHAPLRPRDDRRDLLHRARLPRVSLAADGQLIVNPGHNVDRGPVVAGSLRTHVEI
jgi:hypothetical protein